MEPVIQNTALRNIELFMGNLERNLPLVFDRDTATRMLGGILGKKTLANADSAGNGPAVKLKIGKKVMYEKASFMEWLKSKIRADTQ